MEKFWQKIIKWLEVVFSIKSKTYTTVSNSSSFVGETKKFFSWAKKCVDFLWVSFVQMTQLWIELHPNLYSMIILDDSASEVIYGWNKTRNSTILRGKACCTDFFRDLKFPFFFGSYFISLTSVTTVGRFFPNIYDI